MISFVFDHMERVAYVAPEDLEDLHEGVIEDIMVREDPNHDPRLGTPVKCVLGVTLCIGGNSPCGNYDTTSWLVLYPGDGDSLREFRESMLGRPLTRREEEYFDPEAELKGRHVSYIEEDDGSIAVVLADSVEPLGADEADHDAVLVCPDE